MISPIVRPIVSAIIGAITGELGSSGGGGGPPDSIADAFSADIYTGTSASKIITTDVNLSAGNGLVWLKSRSPANSHALFDTERGVLEMLVSDTNVAETTAANSLTSFNSDGFTIGSNAQINTNTNTYASWSFRKFANFFDIIQYTGNDVVGREIPHALGVVPGMTIVKRSNAGGNWGVQHIFRGGTKFLNLNTDANEVTNSTLWDDTDADASNVTLGGSGVVNNGGSSYIMYVFAHDPAAGGLIQCGQYTGNGSSTGPSITLGWKPQYIMIKKATGGLADWFILDTARGIPAGADPRLMANQALVEETTSDRVDLTATGFDIATGDGDWNESAETYIYMAIREE